MTTEHNPDWALGTFHRDNGELAADGQHLADLVADIDGPAYVYHRNGMSRSVAALRKAMPETLSLHYAVKANPNSAVISHMLGLVDGLDVASAGEARVAVAAGAAPSLISFAGPGKRDAELAYAVEQGITLNVESTCELRRLLAVADSIGAEPQIAFRINPAFELRNAGMKMVGRPTAFGIDMDNLPDAFRLAKDGGARVRGLHIYSGSQNLKVDALTEAFGATLDLATTLADQYEHFAHVNAGGGLGIPYFKGDQPLDLVNLGSRYADLLTDFERRCPDTRVIIELGRFLVGPSGVYVTRVVDVKTSYGRTFAITNGGLNHHLAASGNFGQVIRKDYPVVPVSLDAARHFVDSTVAGPLCTPLDILGASVQLPDPRPGDLVAVMQSGAYGFSASPHRFLGHPGPEELVL